MVAVFSDFSSPLELAGTDNAVHTSTRIGREILASGSEEFPTNVVTATAIDTRRIPS